MVWQSLSYFQLLVFEFVAQRFELERNLKCSSRNNVLLRRCWNISKVGKHAMSKYICAMRKVNENPEIASETILKLRELIRVWLRFLNRLKRCAFRVVRCYIYEIFPLHNIERLNASHNKYIWKLNPPLHPKISFHPAMKCLFKLKLNNVVKNTGNVSVLKIQFVTLYTNSAFLGLLKMFHLVFSWNEILFSYLN